VEGVDGVDGCGDEDGDTPKLKVVGDGVGDGFLFDDPPNVNGLAGCGDGVAFGDGDGAGGAFDDDGAGAAFAGEDVGAAVGLCGDPTVGAVVGATIFGDAAIGDAAIGGIAVGKLADVPSLAAPPPAAPPSFSSRHLRISCFNGILGVRVSEESTAPVSGLVGGALLRVSHSSISAFS